MGIWWESGGWYVDIKWKAGGVLIEKNRYARLVHILLSSVFSYFNWLNGLQFDLEILSHLVEIIDRTDVKWMLLEYWCGKKRLNMKTRLHIELYLESKRATWKRYLQTWYFCRIGESCASDHLCVYFFGAVSRGSCTSGSIWSLFFVHLFSLHVFLT